LSKSRNPCGGGGGRTERTCSGRASTICWTFSLRSRNLSVLKYVVNRGCQPPVQRTHFWELTSLMRACTSAGKSSQPLHGGGSGSVALKIITVNIAYIDIGYMDNLLLSTHRAGSKFSAYILYRELFCKGNFSFVNFSAFLLVLYHEDFYFF
jgi:hypothetical protein